MTDNNARSFIFGANSPLAYDRPVGCKTGTTQNWHDGWTLCFTPSIAIGVWSGNNDGTLLKQGADGVFGGRANCQPSRESLFERQAYGKNSST